MNHRQGQCKPKGAMKSKPIFEEILEISKAIPPDKWTGVPNDLAANSDHYLYGTEKNEK